MGRKELSCVAKYKVEALKSVLISVSRPNVVWGRVAFLAWFRLLVESRRKLGGFDG